jgi:hypothetical protein
LDQSSERDSPCGARGKTAHGKSSLPKPVLCSGFLDYILQTDYSFVLLSVLRMRNNFSADPVPAFKVNADPRIQIQDFDDQKIGKLQQNFFF